MKLSYPILCVMLDGQEHTTEEVVRRIRHLIPPEHAARLRANSIMASRENCRKNRKPNLALREPDVDPAETDVDQAVRWVVERSLIDLVRDRKNGSHSYLDRTEGGWRLREGARNIIRSKQVAGCIAMALRENLRTRGELL